METHIDRQIRSLQARGMIVACEDDARRWLELVGYHRLGAYWSPFEQGSVNTSREPNQNPFICDVSFGRICSIYEFDRSLRSLVFEVICQIEIHARSRWAHHMMRTGASHAHLSIRMFKNGQEHWYLKTRLLDKFWKSEGFFVEHYRMKYRTPESMPIWVAVELMTMGEFSRWFKMTKNKGINGLVGSDLGLPTFEIAENVIDVLSFVRNVCAHNGQLWNRETTTRIMHVGRWETDLVYVEGGQSRQCDVRIYNVLVCLLNIVKATGMNPSFRGRLIDLVQRQEADIRERMGFPKDWLERGAWKQET